MVRVENQSRIERQFNRLDEELGPVFVAAIQDAFDRVGLRWKNAMTQRVRSGAGRFDQESVPFTSTGAPRSRSGRLRRSFRYRVRGTRTATVQLQAFSTAGVVAWVQEFGTKGKNPRSPIATIRPKSSKYLAIPLPAALTPGGRLKKGARGPRDFQNTFFVRNGSKLTLMQASGRYQDRVQPIFAMVRKVDLSPRLGMTSTFEKVINRSLGRELDEAMGRFLGKL